MLLLWYATRSGGKIPRATMGTILYDFLRDSVLFNEERLSDRFAGLTDAQLRRELAQYRTFCLANIDTLTGEIPSSRPNSVVFSGSRRPSVQQLKRTGLYVERHVIDDPLFPFTREAGEIGRTAARHLGYAEAALNRRELCEALQFLLDVTPMVAADYVKFLPVSQIYEPPPESHLTYSENYFSDALPREVMEFIRHRTRVRSMEPANTGWRVLGGVSPCRGLFIDFIGDSWDQGHVYHLHDAKPHIVDEASRLVRFELSLPETPPDAGRFQAWLFQSMNQAARDAHNGVVAEFAMARRCGATYLARCQFTFDLLAMLGGHAASIPARTTASLMELELPFLRGVSAEDLMRIRSDREAFDSLRDAWERGFSELRLEDDPERRRLKTENFVRELTELNVREAGREVARLRKTLMLGAGIAVAGVVGALFGPEASLLTTAAAVFQGLKTHNDYRKATTSNPAFLLWKLKRRTSDPEAA